NILQYVTSAERPSNPSLITSRFIDLEVDFSQIADEDLTKLYYEITEVTTGITKEVKNNRVDKIGTQRVVFRDVELMEGLNKITVILDSASKPRSLPAWIHFTAVAT